MRPEAKKFIWDARLAATRVGEFVAGRNLEEYLANDLLRSAVERQLEIVGEACNQASRADAAIGSRIPELARLVAFRNLLIHGYADVDHRLVWDLVQTKLPQLASVLDGLLSE